MTTETRPRTAHAVTEIAFGSSRLVLEAGYAWTEPSDVNVQVFNQDGRLETHYLVRETVGPLHTLLLEAAVAMLP